MNLHLNHVKCIIICLLLACFCFNVYAQSSTTIGEDTFITTIHDENNNTVSLYLPESMNNDQSLRRIYGTPGGVIGMFETLYSQDRRSESYEAAIRELCLQPGTYDENNYITVLKEELDEAGATAEEAKIVLDLVKYGANSIKKNYIKGGTLPRDLRNKIANVGRKLNAIKKDSAFAKACDVIGGISADIEATKQLTDIITGSLLLNSLATDNALLRLEEIERVIESEGKVDKALKDALTQSRINILASQDDIGAFALYVNDHIRDITDSAMSLGAGLAEMAGKLSGPFAMWVGAPLMTYNTLKGISNQWEMAQDAVTLATLTKMIEENSEDHEDITDNLTSYGQYAFYLKLEETFDVGMAKFHDFINIVGSANRDWAQYYRQKKENTTIIAIKNSNFQENEIELSAKPEMITWEKTYGGRDDDWAYSLVQATDGGYALAVVTPYKSTGGVDVWVIKLDSQGKIIWYKTLGGSKNDEAYSLVQTTDGGYAVAGETSSESAGGDDFWVIKLDNQGNIIWNRTYGGKDDDRARSIIQTTDGGYAVAGLTGSQDTDSIDAWVIKLDNQGKIIWNRTYGGTDDDGAQTIIQTTDGGYAVAGFIDSKHGRGDDAWVIKMDNQGNIIWDRTYGGRDDNWARTIIQTTDGGYGVAGWTYPDSPLTEGAGGEDFWVIKLDSQGNIIWDMTYGGRDDDWADSLIQTTDGGYAIAGNTESEGSGGDAAWVIKLDSQGDIIWKKGNVYSLIQTTDGGYALAGNTESQGTGSYDAWVLKMDESGNIVKGLEKETLKKTYALRDTGPAGGYIFYDKGSYSDGWRYLEAAPEFTEWNKNKWSSSETLIGGTKKGIGTGKSNTTIIVTWLNSHSITDCAAQLCDALDYGGYSDWFLPSIDELNLMYINLKAFAFGVGGFDNRYYLSSSERIDGYVLVLDFDEGGQNIGPKGSSGLVRAVRAF